MLAKGAGLMRVLLTGARAPAALHLAKLLHQGGATVIAADCIGWPLTRGAEFVEKTLRHPAPAEQAEGFRSWLQLTIQEEGIDLVVPSCEEVLHLAQAMTALGMEDKLYAPSFQQLIGMHNKYHFIQAMDAWGFKVPETHLIQTQDDLRALGQDAHDMVLKPVWSRFAARVLIRPDTEELQGIKSSIDDPWIAQELLDGKEVCIYAVGREGRLGGWTAYHPEVRVGQGAGIHFTPVRDPRIEEFLEVFFAKTSWTGQISFDVFLTSSGCLVPIECNPRATSGIHFATEGDDFVAALRGDRRVLSSGSQPLQISEAMLIFGLPTALKAGRLAEWASAWRAGQSAGRYAGQHARGVVKIACFFELALGALRKRKSLLAGSTEGIEWNGHALPDNSI
jgi:glutathione synthase/RimK-type ligase-like ATP-grasp enzyme